MDAGIAVAAGEPAPFRQGENNHATSTVPHEAGARYWQPFCYFFILMVCSPYLFQLVSNSASLVGRVLMAAVTSWETFMRAGQMLR